MDLKQYYAKIREQQQALDRDYVVVVSKPTADGGKAGVLTEVTKQAAAKLVVDGRAEIATAEQANEYYEALRQTHEEMKAEQERAQNAAEVFS